MSLHILSSASFAFALGAVLPAGFAFRAARFGRFCVWCGASGWDCVSCEPLWSLLHLVRSFLVGFAFRATLSAVFAFRAPSGDARNEKPAEGLAPSAITAENYRTKRKDDRRAPSGDARNAKTADRLAPSAIPAENYRTKRKSSRRALHQAQRRPKQVPVARVRPSLWVANKPRVFRNLCALCPARVVPNLMRSQIRLMPSSLYPNKRRHDAVAT